MSSVDTILSLVKNDVIDVVALEAAFDAATHEERVEATRAFNAKIQRRVFDACVNRMPTLDDMVPTDEPLKEVIHVGTNTLPAFRHFEKRFCRPSAEHDDGKSLWGYNHNWYWQFTTPGYYAAYVEADEKELWVDYTRSVPEKAASWPPIMPNKKRLGHVVFAGMVDHVRKVSEHVTIGRAFKKNAMNAWFTLVRDDSSFS